MRRVKIKLRDSPDQSPPKRIRLRCHNLEHPIKEVGNDGVSSDGHAIPAAPIFYPTEDQFKDPMAYIQSIAGQVEPYGICKIVPPDSYKPPFSLDNEFKFATRRQSLNEIDGMVREKLNHLRSVVRYTLQYSDQDVSKIKLSDLDKFGQVLEEYQDFVNQVRLGGHPLRDFVIPVEPDCCEICTLPTSTSDAECSRCDVKFHKQCVPQFKQDLVEKDRWFCVACLSTVPDFAFQVGREFTIKTYKQMAEQFQKYTLNSQKYSEKQIEQMFWRNVNDLDCKLSVEYAADVATDTSGGFAKNSADPWNLNNLPKSDGSLLKLIDNDISGMMVPWLYVGMLFSAFCWHTEDHHTYSINYLHQGSTKIWYGVPYSQLDKFEQVMKRSMPSLFREDPTLLHHITTTLDPSVLIVNGVDVYTVRQRWNEFVVTFPGSYHSGFNTGFNVAEAVNFALPDWLPLGITCSEKYRSFRKSPVFSMNELIFSMYNKGHRNQVYPVLQEVLAKERLARQKTNQQLQPRQVVRGSLSSTRSRAKDASCTICSHLPYFSYLSCQECSKSYCHDHSMYHSCPSRMTLYIQVAELTL